MPTRKQSPMARTLRSLFSAVIVVVVIIIAAVNYLTAPAGTTATPTAAVPNGVTASAPTSGAQGMPGWLNVYFTNPNPPDALGSGVDQIVQPVIDGAAKTIDVTSFDLNLPSLVNALVNASKRGVVVRVVYDGTNGSQTLNNAVTNNKDFDAIKTLKAGKVGVVDGGRSTGLMHDKMMIVDGKTLFMGSWNLSYNDTYRNNNNLLKITDPTLIANYQAKFNELFVDQHFGTHAKVQALTSEMTIDGVQVENYFSPPDHVMDKLVAAVKGARKSVHFMIFTYTDTNLAAAMIAGNKAGLDVQGVIENRGASQGALVPLFCAKVPVKLDGNKYTMHHKVIILDGQTVVTGSFNFTKAADTENDDNLLIIHSPAVAAQYEQEYQRVNSIATAPQAADIKCH